MEIDGAITSGAAVVSMAKKWRVWTSQAQIAMLSAREGEAEINGRSVSHSFCRQRERERERERESATNFLSNLITVRNQSWRSCTRKYRIGHPRERHVSLVTSLIFLFCGLPTLSCLISYDLLASRRRTLRSHRSPSLPPRSPNLLAHRVFGRPDQRLSPTKRHAMSGQGGAAIECFELLVCFMLLVLKLSDLCHVYATHVNRLTSKFS